MLSFLRRCSRRTLPVVFCSALLIIFSITPDLFAQSEFVQKGTSAVCLFGSYQTVAEFDGTIWSFGFSFDGLSNVGMSHGKMSTDNGIEVRLYKAYLDVHLIKSDREKQPMSLALGGGFQVEGYGIKGHSSDYDIKVLTLGGVVLADLVASPIVFLQPSFGLSWVKVFGPGKDQIAVVGGLSLCCRIPPSSALVVSGGFGYFEETQYSIGLGILFGYPSEESKGRSR